MDKVVYDSIGGAYRNNNITTLELRYCPMWRNRKGEHDLDHIIMATLNGFDRAMLAYPQIKVGLILEFDRRLTRDQNAVILEKAIKYKNRGVVGVDIAGPRVGEFNYLEYVELFEEAKRNGLGTTIHTGEDGSVEEMKQVVGNFPLDRIGHGVKSAWDEDLMAQLVEKNIVLEICPTSNLTIGIIKDVAELKFVLRTFLDHEVKFTINTDGPQFFQTTVKKEISLLLDNDILSIEEMKKISEIAHKASFITSSDYYQLSPAQN